MVIPKIKREKNFKQKILKFKKTFLIELPILIGKDSTNYIYNKLYKTLKKISIYKICKIIYEL